MTSRADIDEDFAGFVVARSARLVHIAHMLCGDRAQAQDIAQTAMEKVYRKWDRIRLADPFAYVRQVVVNECRMGWRRMPRVELSLDSDGETEPGGRPVTHVDDPAVGVSLRMDLMDALGTLTRRERTVVVLRYVENLSEADTARLVGIAPGTVKSTLSRARGKLRNSRALSPLTSGAPS